jgi:hypothetical protein
MLRAKLYKTHTLYGYVWGAQVGKTITYWGDFDKALAALNRMMTRVWKEESAYSMVRTIRAIDLNVAEADLVRKLCKSKCRGITPKQWGYIKGIHERQVKNLKW